ncbi:SUMF1/EgtB/PvdO family nonheme iron enzyme, partial [bacterium]|nr:SUMF1/EgtB/PvdO family nonheme iron enzyme [bacterium]
YAALGTGWKQQGNWKSLYPWGAGERNWEQAGYLLPFRPFQPATQQQDSTAADSAGNRGPVEPPDSPTDGEITRIPVCGAVARHPSGNSLTGLSDMVGNVAEWTLSSRAFASGERQYTLYSIKGGCFIDPLENCQLGKRAWRDPREALQTIGFRCIVRKEESGQ